MLSELEASHAQDNYLFLEGEEVRMVLDVFEPAWDASIAAFTDKLGKHFQSSSSTQLASDQIAKSELRGLLQLYKDETSGLITRMELAGHRMTNKYLIANGLAAQDLSNVSDPLQPITVKAWDNCAADTLLRFRQAVRLIPLGTTWNKASAAYAAAYENALLQTAWRATRIVRTEASAAYHHGGLAAIVGHPGASHGLMKILTNKDGLELEVRRPLERFRTNSETGFYAPPAHPNSLQTMVVRVLT